MGRRSRGLGVRGTYWFPPTCGRHQARASSAAASAPAPVSAESAIRPGTLERRAAKAPESGAPGPRTIPPLFRTVPRSYFRRSRPGGPPSPSRKPFCLRRFPPLRLAIFPDTGYASPLVCYPGESGGIGRRTGLRIQRFSVGVQLPPLAPDGLTEHSRTSCFD